MHKYLVECWIYPKSGFDLARKNRIMQLFKEMLSEEVPDQDALDRAVERFEREHEGMILEPMVIESDKELEDVERELMPEILRKYPEAKFLNSHKMPELI